MSFKQLLYQAQGGDTRAVELLSEMYRPLLLKESVICNTFDEDLFQELCLTMLACIRKIRI